MVKTAQSVAHRLKEDETSDESAKESKPTERNHIGVQDVGVKVSFRQRKYGNNSVPFIQCLFHSSLVQYKKQTFFLIARPLIVFAQVIEAPCPNGVASDTETLVSSSTCAQSPSTTEAKDTSESLSSKKNPLRSSEGLMMNHEDTLEVINNFMTFSN